jgi:hypothetical protein
MKPGGLSDSCAEPKKRTGSHEEYRRERFHPDKEQLRRLRFEALAAYPQARPNCFVVSSPAGGSLMFILLVGESQGKLER